VSIGIETLAGEMAVGKTPRSRAIYLALMSAWVEMLAGGMAVGKTPRSRTSGECRDRDASWRDGCRQGVAQ